MDDDGLDIDIVTMILQQAKDMIRELQRPRNLDEGGPISHNRGGNRINPQVVKLVQRLAEQAHVTDRLKPLNARSCVVCGDGTKPLTMRSNGFKCSSCQGKPSKQKYVVIPEEFSHLDERRTADAGDAVDRNLGKIVNDYVLEKRLGKGSQATVYIAHHVTNPGQKFAVKAVARTHNPAAILQVNREFNIMKTLNHPSLIHIIALINDPNAKFIYIVMEMLSRGQIFDPPQKEGDRAEPVPIERLKKYIVGIASGLQYLHRKGIFHRDIKPENILVDDNDNVRVADFGVSCVGDGGDLDSVQSGEGTPMYFPPENFGNEQVHGKAQDIWAFGVTIYVMAIGVYPFPIIPSRMQINIERMPIEYPDDLDPELRDLLSKMLVREPSKRIGTQGILNHPFVSTVHQSKGYPVEPITGTIACVKSRDKMPPPDEGADGVFIINEQARKHHSMATLSDFIEKKGPRFQVVTAEYSATLYATQDKKKGDK